MTDLAPVLQSFFIQRLAQRRASPATVANYRDTYRLLLKYAAQRTGKPPSKLTVADLDATLICAFLDHLETARSNTAATRNTRLIAIRSLYSHAALNCPQDAETIRRVLAIPNKRTDTHIVSYLTRDETDALLASPDRDTPLGRRDHALLLVAVQTGMRVSELTSSTCSDVAFGTGANIHTNGKGRRQRCTPLLPDTAKLLQTWLRQRRAEPQDPLFPARTGGHLSTDAVKDLLDKHVRRATTACPSLGYKHVTPHTLRHTCAMHLLQSGIDVVTIALWLGHSSTQATQAYLHADMQLKQQALLRTSPTPQGPNRYKAPDSLLAYLESL